MPMFQLTIVLLLMMDKPFQDFLETYHYDFVCLQETWLLEMNLDKLADIHKSYDY